MLTAGESSKLQANTARCSCERGMNTSHPNEPLAESVSFRDGFMWVKLTDGRVIQARYDVFPRLRKATDKQRTNWKLIGDGVGIHWPDIDEDLSTESLLRDSISVAPAKKRA